MDMRAEVGLLSRNIVVMGEMEDRCYPYSNHICSFFDFDTFGGHIKVRVLAAGRIRTMPAWPGPGPGRAGEQKAGPGRERPELCCPSRQHSATRQMSPPPRHTAHRAPCLHGFRPSATVLVLFLRCPPHPEGSPEERAFDSHSPAYHRSMQVQIKQQGAGGKCRVWREACPRAFRAETEIPAAESSPGNESKRLSVLGARACLALSPKRTFVGIPV